MDAVDLFCGGGFMSVGFENHFNILAGIDNNEKFLGVYNDNLVGNAYKRDLMEVEPDEFFVGRTPSTIDLVFGGPPCQGFSNESLITGKLDDRNNLVLKFLSWIDELQPKAFVMENVPGINNTGEYKKKFIGLADQLGYNVNVKKLKAEDYGVPQKRRRWFFVGMKNNEFEFPDKIDQTKTVEDAIYDLPRIQEGGGSNNIKGFTDHESTRSRSKTIERMSHIPQGGNWQDISKELQTKSMKEGTKHGNSYYRLNWDEPSPTVANFRKTVMIHPSTDRTISCREAMRLQSVPDDFRLNGLKLSEKQQLIANGVPCKLAENVAESLEEQLQ